MTPRDLRWAVDSFEPVVRTERMGTISYDHLVVKIDDRTLAHLQIVIVNKLRRGEAFLMSWKDSTEAGSGRSAIWLHPQVLVHFKFDGSRSPAINPEWLAALAESADSSRGLIVTAEHGEVPDLAQAPRVRATGTVMEAATDDSRLRGNTPHSSSGVNG